MRSFSLFTLFALLLPVVAVIAGQGDVTIFEHRQLSDANLCPTSGDQNSCPPPFGPGRNLRPISNQKNTVSWATFSSTDSTFSLTSSGTYLIEIVAFTDTSDTPNRITLFNVDTASDVYAGPAVPGVAPATISHIVTNPDSTTTTYAVYHDISQGQSGYFGFLSYYGCGIGCLQQPTYEIYLTITIRQLSTSI